jgi:hypothetical protein
MHSWGLKRGEFEASIENDGDVFSVTTIAFICRHAFVQIMHA